MRVAAVALWLGLASTPAWAQIPPQVPAKPAPPPAQLDAKKAEVVQKGVKFLVSSQEPDGSWSYKNSPVVHVHYPMKAGVTALCALALLKCGVDPQEAPIQRAFEYLDKAEPRFTYEQAVILLAAEARAAWTPPPPPGSGSEGGTATKKSKPKPDALDLKLARRALAFLLQHQTKTGLWRYPGPGDEEDLSNSQYVMLALWAAERLGLDVPKAVYERAALRLIECQEQDGPDVPSFPFPGADLSFKELKKIEEEFEKELRKLDKRFEGKAAEARDEKGETRADAMRTIERGAAQRVQEGTRTRGKVPGERPGMKARGWTYAPPGQPRQHRLDGIVTGSMVTSGLAGLLVCKSQLEGTSRYEKELKGRINQALRDGAAWLALNFSVTQNPNSDLHHFYFLYGLERAGVLGVLDKLGTHDWYLEGATYLIGAQFQSDGHWLAAQGTASEVPDTCFALLFLARGTVPVVRLPSRVRTGD